MKYDKVSDSFISQKAFEGKFITGIDEDSRGHMWVSTYADGVYSFDPFRNTLTGTYKYPDGLSTNKFSGIFIDGRDRVWAIGFSFGFFRFDRYTDTFIRYSRENLPALPSDVFFNAMDDREGNLWLSGDMGIVRFNPETEEVKSYSTAVGLLDDVMKKGAMKNYNYKWYKPCYVDPVSQGTRCHQLGMYIIFESPFNMLCDAPQHYEQESECTEFIAQIPTVWDETLALEGKVGDYIVIARRRGDKWYIGGLTGQNGHTVKLDLDFLGRGDWKAELFEDGINAIRNAEDYKKSTCPADRTMIAEMAPGGGFAAILSKH